MTRIFISYAKVDIYLVKQLVGILYAASHDPWFDHQLIPGQDWKMQLVSAIDRCGAFVYALTPESVASEWCRWEFAKAVELGKTVIPVLFQTNTQLPEAVQRFQYVDFTQGPTPEATARLLAGLARRTTVPPFIPTAPENPQGFPSRLPDEAITPYRVTTQPARPEQLAVTRVPLARTIPHPRLPRKPIHRRRLIMVLLLSLLMVTIGPMSYHLWNNRPLSAADNTPIPTKHAQPTLAAQTTTCSSIKPSRLVIGDVARIPPELGSVFRLNIRAAAGRESPVVARLYAGEWITIVGGPDCADNLTWWRIQTDDGRSGWAAESDKGGYYMTPIQR